MFALDEPWTDDAMWDTPDGVNSWDGGTPHGHMRATYLGDDGTTIDFEAQDMVSQWVDGSLDNNGLRLSNGSGLYYIDGIAGGTPPKLTIDYTE